LGSILLKKLKSNIDYDTEIFTFYHEGQTHTEKFSITPLLSPSVRAVNFDVKSLAREYSNEEFKKYVDEVSELDESGKQRLYKVKHPVFDPFKRSLASNGG
jgi:isocitrate lyase